MSAKVHSELIDDLEAAAGKEVEAHTTITFGIDGDTFEVDLCARNVAILRSALSPFLVVARPVGG
ncbi:MULTISPECIES: Lsr2 dimerization domain-containing protein [Actinopolyspora]|uniref:Lsr2 protein n=1 Tax=Actinopolyspora saharensis TaxID=995062 RepID=A0A1H1F335_9ACTN|nr:MULTISPECIES: histone-like nucleoid-structuring protein Lsr2 [Actinopolyspora]NHD18341.1 hypothetical protein [Actinopolyspora sp. BKK2]NHE76980.1 hypothetical protein [Actinopolyspora sp. BKK1]SDQ95300.1 Lsr2 protein [Actinopolyspora saharensis]